ncbi:tRNA (adenosine(37)-N6)-threonylcarbamoyltransferase complex ATPase subunit type 1 TsaE [Citricoccus sp.]|uniref:tRNA (adenosine(37)-N6)-threonylcarbamoyltransferase complex ATPase subunit type 1 TsaE n=1 Tax=Citricoccus sp. TaxID=1978372 RepID=UPI0028BD9737|nr:tRNA (adenosine(37)-N6)-threonylcarbamoyltransferase complex ATPase subunit type 1 TsaE [Citricoccus sp.]
MKDLTGAASRLPEPVSRLEVELDGAEATQAWAARLASVLHAGDVLILTGELGAGKTTFTQGLGAGLGVREGIISPTFVLSRIHPALGAGSDLVHVDAYRLGSAGELSDLDLDATVDRSVTVVEWGRGLAESLAGWPDDPDASWLDIELIRATGSGEPGDAGTRADAEAGTIVTDFSDEDGTGADETRTAVVLGFGPRWAGVELPN